MKRSPRRSTCMSIAALALVAALTGVNVAGAAPSAHEQPAWLVRAGASDVVYLVASTGCVGAQCLRLYRTTVDASHFTPVAAPPVEGENGGVANTTLSSLVFANANDGYAEVGRGYPVKLYATSNGARTWKQIVLPRDTDLLNIAVTSKLVYATTAQCRLGEGNCEEFRVWRSSLALRHWTELPSLWKTGTGPKDNYYGPDVSAFGDTVWELENGYQEISLWISHNEGRTFTRTNTPDLASVAGCDLTPMSLTDLWAECPTGLEVSFLDSHDAGQRWHPISRYVFSGTGGGAFDPISSNVAYLDYGLVNIRGFNLFRISDGGLLPTAVDKLKCTNVSLLFTNENHGLADCEKNYASNELERTINGGSEWRVVALP